MVFNTINVTSFIPFDTTVHRKGRFDPKTDRRIGVIILHDIINRYFGVDIYIILYYLLSSGPIGGGFFFFFLFIISLWSASRARVNGQTELILPWPVRCKQNIKSLVYQPHDERVMLFAPYYFSAVWLRRLVTEFSFYPRRPLLFVPYRPSENPAK